MTLLPTENTMGVGALGSVDRRPLTDSSQTVAAFADAASPRRSRLVAITFMLKPHTGRLRGAQRALIIPRSSLGISCEVPPQKKRHRRPAPVPFARPIPRKTNV